MDLARKSCKSAPMITNTPQLDVPSSHHNHHLNLPSLCNSKDAGINFPKSHLFILIFFKCLINYNSIDQLDLL